jgi:DNA-binding response OmpR family regulator
MAQTPITHLTGPSARLMIVDDEEKFCRLLAQHFSLTGYDVRAVRCGEEALAVAPVFRPQLVLLDLVMPGMNGAQICKGLQHLVPPPKVLVVSAVDQDELLRATQEAGAEQCVCKPINLDELDQIVHRLLPPPR